MHHNKTVLITGGSSGIGFELAKLFVAAKYNVVLVARDITALNKSAALLQTDSVFVKTLSKDLSLPESPQEIYNELLDENIEIDILINNAGFATYGPFIETNLEKELDELQVNIIALTHLTKIFVKDMVKRNTGKILNIGSTAAFLPGPLMAVYYASKAYVVSFSEALASELSNTNITVSVLCPGPTNTGFVKRAQAEKSRLFHGKNGDPKNVAATAFKDFMNGKTLIIPGFQNKVLVMLARLLPMYISARIVKYSQQSE